MLRQTYVTANGTSADVKPACNIDADRISYAVFIQAGTVATVQIQLTLDGANWIDYGASVTSNTIGFLPRCNGARIVVTGYTGTGRVYLQTKG